MTSITIKYIVRDIMDIEFKQFLERYDEHVRMIQVFQNFLKEKSLEIVFDDWLTKKYEPVGTDKNLHN